MNLYRTYASLSLVAWKLEPPARVLAYVGSTSFPTSGLATLSPHKILPKVLLNERSKRPNPCRIGLAPGLAAGDPDALVRASLAAHPIQPFEERLHAKPYRGTVIVSHALEEATVALLRPPPPANHKRIPLHGSAQWDQAYMDSRYAREGQRHTALLHTQTLHQPPHESNQKICTFFVFLPVFLDFSLVFIYYFLVF